MTSTRLFQVLKGPHVSEKSATAADERRQIVFKVAKEATKTSIKQAVEAMFNVKVDHVRTVTMPGKTKRFRQTLGKQKPWKKAYVALAEGHDINFAEVE